MCVCIFFFFQAEDGIRDSPVTGVQTCALPISGNTTGAAKTSNSTLSLYWRNYGLGFNQMSYKSTSSDDNEYNMQNSSIELSYTTDFSFRGVNNYSATLGFGRIFSGSGIITSESPGIEFESENVSGFGIDRKSTRLNSSHW